MTRTRSVLIAALIVCSAVIGTAGPALAQTATDSGPVTYEYTGSPTTLIVDTSNLDGGTEFTVEYTTQGGPSTGTTVLARETYNTANLKEDQLLFFNEGAYESVNVTVSDYSGGEPTFDSKSGVLGGLNLVRTVVGTTGGDSDLTCDTSDKIGSMTSGVEYLDCTAQPGSTTVNTTGTDATQTKLDIYQSAQNSKSQATNYQTTLDNYLSDTKTQARIIGKNAYIKALNNGSSKAAAKTEAKNAVADYYAVKQSNLATQWDIALANHKYLKETANSEGIATNSDNTNTLVSFTENDADVSSSANAYGQSYGSESLTLVNSSTITASNYRAEMIYGDGSSQWVGTFSITTGDGNTVASGDANQATPTGLVVGPPNSNYDSAVLVADFSRFSSQWNEIESQNQQVQNDMDTLAENTYSAYQSGEINSSDLVDPYVLASQQSAGDDFQGWTAAQLTLLGTNSPENFDQIGKFEVSTSNSEYEGVLFSQENPASGQFESGQTYDASTLGGTQYVVTSDRIVELNGQFTIGNITDTNGEKVQNVTVEKTTYKTTNVTELKQQYEDLAYRRAQIEAREQALKEAGGGGGFLGGGSMNKTAAVVIVALVLVLGIINN